MDSKKVQRLNDKVESLIYYSQIIDRIVEKIDGIKCNKTIESLVMVNQFDACFLIGRHKADKTSSLIKTSAGISCWKTPSQ